LKDIGKILLYLIATVLLGALLAPALFWGAHALTDRIANQRLIQFLAETDFQRFFNRAVLISAFVLLWPLVRSLRIRNFFDDLGLARDRRRWRHLATGLFIAITTMILLGAVLVWTDCYYLKKQVPWEKLAWLLPTAFSVAIIEELLFRGGIQGVVQRSVTDDFALIFVAALFAIVHFLRPEENVVASNAVTWKSGYALVPHAFWQFEQPQLLLGGFTTIFLLGLLLGYTRCRTRSLWMPIGLHAGFILGKMSFSKMTKRTAEAWPWFGPDILVGLGPVIVLLVVGIIIWLLLRNEEAR